MYYTLSGGLATSDRGERGEGRGEEGRKGEEGRGRKGKEEGKGREGARQNNYLGRPHLFSFF